MSEVNGFEANTSHVQQVIVPAYVWQDAALRTALLVRAAQTMLQSIEAGGWEVVGDVGDAEVTPTFLAAAVTEADGTRFVAYELCEPGQADLVFVAVQHPIRQRT